MSSQLIFSSLLIIVVFDFVLERVLHGLNRNHAKKPIPQELAGIYDPERYTKSQTYLAELSRFGTFSGILSFAVMLLAIGFGWFGWLHEHISKETDHSLLTTFIFFGTLFGMNLLIGIPFSLYKNFVIEEKYGFNKMSLKTFWLDKLKGLLLTILLGGGLLWVFLMLIDVLGEAFWLYFWG